MKIDFVAWGNTITGLSFKPDDKNSAITAEAFRYTIPISYKGEQLMEIHQTGDGRVLEEEVSDEDRMHQSIPLAPTDAGNAVKATDSPLAKKLKELKKDKPTLVALVSLPTANRCTVLLAPMGKGLYQSYVIEDDPSKLPLGQVRVLNLSPHRIQMGFNNTTSKELATSEAFVVPASKGGIIYEMAYLLEKKWVIQENNMLAVTPDEQVQLIVLKSNNQYFLSADGSRSGFLQIVRLKRKPKP